MKKLLLLTLAFVFAGMAKAEDGHKLWLRQTPVNKAVVTGPECIAAQELRTYSNHDVTLKIDASLQDDEYRIADGVISAKNEIGLLYGAYAYLRGETTGSKPFYKLRILNHWDNLNGTIERGYAGLSIFWKGKEGGKTRRGHTIFVEDPDQPIDVELIKEYARANASIGINGTVLNNVNASPKMLSAVYINKVKQYADIMRPYGIKVYLSVNFASPMTIPAKGFNKGKTLKTADPLNPQVKAWWKAKAKEIYALIPDFGGFLVKANSEGQPGPFDYHRTHADGANMLADAVKPFGGIIMWRSFVYGAAHAGEDRVKQAVSEFASLDGKFRDNVILQSDGRAPDHTGVSWSVTSSCISGTHVARVLRLRSPREARGHSRCSQHRSRHQLVRPSFLSGQLVRLRPPRLESSVDKRSDCQGVAGCHFRSAITYHQSPITPSQRHAEKPRSLRRLHDANRPAPHLRLRRALRTRA